MDSTSTFSKQWRTSPDFRKIILLHEADMAVPLEKVQQFVALLRLQSQAEIERRRTDHLQAGDIEGA